MGALSRVRILIAIQFRKIFHAHLFAGADAVTLYIISLA